MSHFLQSHGLYPARFPCSWDFPGKNTGVSCHFLLRWSSPFRDWNCVSSASGTGTGRQVLYLQHHLGSVSYKVPTIGIQTEIFSIFWEKKKKENISKWRPWAPCNSSDSAFHFNLLEVISVHRIKAKAHQGWNILIPNEALVSFTWGDQTARMWTAPFSYMPFVGRSVPADSLWLPNV